MDWFAVPSLFRVQRSARVALANLMNVERVVDMQNVTLAAAGVGYDPREWSMVLRQDEDGLVRGAECAGGAASSVCAATPALERPVLWQWAGLAVK